MIYTYDSTMPGAPVLSGTAGALRTLLKTCLVDGFGSGAVAALSVASNVATASYGAGHSFVPGSTALITGATPTELNGEKTVLTTSGSTITYAAPGVADGAATGSITSKVASAGWQELFPAALTNVIAIKPSVVEATQCVLRVDDTGAQNARVRAYEAMTDISTGVGPTPLEAQCSGGLYWPKSSSADSAARPWRLVADARGFYLAVAPGYTQPGNYTLLYAGDIASLKSGDAYGYLLTGNQSDQTDTSYVPDGCVGYSHRSARSGAYLVRASTGIGQSVAVQRIGAHHNGSTADVYAGTPGYSWGAYPNSSNNGLMTSPLEVVASSIRGVLPGLLHCVQDMGAAFATGAFVDGTDDFASRRLLAVRTGPPTGSATGTVMLDTTGPWSR